ncbi:MAG: hypothetical protein AB8B63_00835 [Granulosicoccus sp.]
MKAQLNLTPRPMIAVSDEQALLTQHIVDEQTCQFLPEGADESVKWHDPHVSTDINVTGDHVKDLAKALDRGTCHLKMLFACLRSAGSLGS